jgi:xanthine dehydrogenase accessory factor
MMRDELVVVRGGGDLGTGVAWRLHRAGFPIVVLERERPLTVRRTVAFSTAVTDGSITVEEVKGVLVDDPDAAVETRAKAVAVLVADSIPAFPRAVSVVVDARLAKRPLDTRREMAPLVIGLGPGFVAGDHAHAVIETNRGHRLGKVIWQGTADPDTGIPGTVGGESERRVLRADADGEVRWQVEIGDLVEEREAMGVIDDHVVAAPLSGVVRGLIAEGPVKVGLKVGDIDPRGDPSVCYEISDKSRSVAGGVLEAVMTWLHPQ